MKLAIITAFTFFCHFAYSQDNFQVIGTLLNDNANGSKVFLSLDMGENKILDSAIIENKQFKFENTLRFPVSATLYNRECVASPKDALSFYIDPSSDIEIHLNDIYFSRSQVFGGKSQTEYKKLIDELHKLGFDKISSEIKAYRLKQKETRDSIKIRHIQSKIAALFDEYFSLRLRYARIRIGLAREHPGSFVFASALKSLIKQEEGLKLMDTIQQVFGKLEPTVKKASIGREINRLLHHYRASATGAKAPDFSAIDVNDQSFELSSYRGQYILLDFWASWCMPCVAEFPLLKSFQEEYKNKLAIVGISEDEDVERWKHAIDQHEIGVWKQISLKENDSEELEERYFVNVIPVKVLIDPSGTIVGRWRGGGDRNREELRSFLRKVMEE